MRSSLSVFWVGRIRTPRSGRGQALEHQHVVERWTSALGAIRAGHRPLKFRPEQLEIDHGTQPLQAVTLGRQPGQSLLEIKQPGLPAHPILPLHGARASDRAGKGEVFGGLQLVRHRLMPRTVRPAWRPRLVEHGLNGLNIGFWSRLDGETCTDGVAGMLPAPSVAEVWAAVRASADVPFTYAYFADEITDCHADPAVAQAVRQFARRLQEGGTTPLLTAYPLEALRIDGPFIWALHADAFADPAGLKPARASGQSLWSYNSVHLDNYSPKWLLDYPATNFRLQPGFISQSVGLTGLLYGAVDYWTLEDPWNDVARFSAVYPGEGVLTYLGSWVGTEAVAPGLRLKWLREGVEDYEYVALSKRRGEGELALRWVRTVGGSFLAWSRDPQAVYAVRDRLGRRLHELGSR